MAYRRTFRSTIFTSFVTPALFLAAMGLGLGSYVDSGDSAALGGISYLAFLAPGLLAAAAMNSASFEATFPIMSGLEWSRIFHAMYATPISPRDITLGNLLFIAARLTLICGGLHAGHRPVRGGHVGARRAGHPGGVLTGMAFAAPIAAFTATQKTPIKFNALFRFVITPLFLFSGTFFPVSSLPLFLQPIAWLTPLYHGVVADPGPVARDDLRGSGRSRSSTSCSSSCSSSSGRGSRCGRSAGGWCADDRPPPHADVHVRQPPLGEAHRAEPVRLQARLDGHLPGFFEPLFYLLGIGFGIGALVGTGRRARAARRSRYQQFVAPALLASSAMNGAIQEATFNFFFKLNYNKTFASILSTPLSPGDIAMGELGWALIRGGLYAIGFMVVIAVLGLIVSPWVILAFPAALLVGFAFGAVGMACTSFMRSWQDFDLINIVVLPMFLFSATFYPITAYPPALQTLVEITPLYQGVDLSGRCRSGYITPVLLVHVAYLTVMGVIGLVITSRRLDKLLLK